MARVSRLLGEWAEGLGLDDDDRTRWRAAGYLHDALRDADPETLRPRVPLSDQSLPAPLLHGPAAAERLRIDGLEDGAILTAVAWHTLGDPRFGRLGRALYSADFLEPGRRYLPEWREGLRARMPDDLAGVTLEVARTRISHWLDRHRPLFACSVAFWNRLVEEGT
jgi:2-amino-4-hydroxy-6-hydroxymethyldihydropteridine diphosphokinase